MGFDLLKRGFKSNSEKIAIKYRAELGKEPFHPLSAFDLAQHLRVLVTTPVDVGLSYKEAMNLMHSKSGWSALTIKNVVNQFIIIHNPKHSPNRQQSNVMHELAHVICDHPLPEVDGSIILLRHFDKTYEAEAEWLGANLQITRAGLVWCLRRGMDAQSIAKYYQASVQLVRFRMNATGVNKQFNRLRGKGPS